MLHQGILHYWYLHTIVFKIFRNQQWQNGLICKINQFSLSPELGPSQASCDHFFYCRGLKHLWNRLVKKCFKYSPTLDAELFSD